MHKGMDYHKSCEENGCYKERHVCDFSQHEGWYDYGITPTDIDYVVERNSNILIQEWKQPGKDLPKGQNKLFKHWAGFNRQAGYQKFTIMQVAGYAGRMEVVEFRFYLWRPSDIHADHSVWGAWLPPEKYEPACRSWFKWADNNWFYEKRNLRV